MWFGPHLSGFSARAAWSKSGQDRRISAFDGSFMAMGSGKHMLPVKADVRKAIGKEAGQRVTVQLTERLK